MSKIRNAKQAKNLRDAVVSAQNILGIYDNGAPALAHDLYCIGLFALSKGARHPFQKIVLDGVEARLNAQRIFIEILLGDVLAQAEADARAEREGGRR